MNMRTLLSVTFIMTSLTIIISQTACPSSLPSSQPSGQPSSQPTAQPSSQPSGQPSSHPTGQPSSQPTGPSSQPTGQPSSQPTGQPSSEPSGPSSQPTGHPSSQPTGQPSSQPTGPSSQPTGQPSSQPTEQPSLQPTGQPSSQPSGRPSSKPTEQPSSQPTEQPSSQPSGQPLSQPTGQPSSQPSTKPSQPSGQPSSQPSSAPTISHSPSLPPSSSPKLIVRALKEITKLPLQPVSDGPPPAFYPLEFVDHVFSAIILVLCAGISSYLCFGYTSKQSRETFIGLILLTMLGFQLFHLLRAALYVPATQFLVFNKAFHRTDCLESVKGGKRPFKSEEYVDRNPCFCLSPAICTLRSTGKRIDINGGFDCPIDGSADCLDGHTNGTQIKPFISHFRNCMGGQGVGCTRDQPCFPCERETLQDWSGTGRSYGIARCRTCSSEFSGDCNFIPDVGPFCYDRVGSKKVVPCRRCCTEPAPFFLNGTCY